MGVACSAMLGRRSSERRAWRAVATAAALVAAAAVALPSSPASAKVVHRHPTFPTCADFSQRKISDLLGVGRMYLNHTLVRGLACTYYGLPPAQANALATKSVPGNQITYIPSLFISIERSRKRFYNLEVRLLESSHLDVRGVARPLRVGSDEVFGTRTLSSVDLPPCEEGILYDNWTGPPSCQGQPELRQIAVAAWIETRQGGLLLYMSAGSQVPLDPIYLSHMLELAKRSVTGELY